MVEALRSLDTVKLCRYEGFTRKNDNLVTKVMAKQVVLLLLSRRDLVAQKSAHIIHCQVAQIPIQFSNIYGSKANKSNNSNNC